MFLFDSKIINHETITIERKNVRKRVYNEII